MLKVGHLWGAVGAAAVLALAAGPVGRGNDAPAPGTKPAGTAGGSMQATVWEIDNLAQIGGHKVEVAGRPKVIDTDRGKAVAFDGQQDGLWLPVNPAEGLAAFTLEALFQPDADGAGEQRFVHLQEDAGENRVLLELRLPPGGAWYGDTYIRSGSANCALNDPKALHAAGEWHTLALVCDGRQMTQYVDGVKELSAPVAFTPMGKGRASLGARINRVSWFKGALCRVRISPRALAPGELMKP